MAKRIDPAKDQSIDETIRARALAYQAQTRPGYLKRCRIERDFALAGYLRSSADTTRLDGKAARKVKKTSLTRGSSAEAYREIIRDGLLRKAHFKMYEAIYRYGPMTAVELWKWHFRGHKFRSFAPQVSMLKKLGVIHCAGHRRCTVAGQMRKEWDVTNKIPKQEDVTV